MIRHLKFLALSALLFLGMAAPAFALGSVMCSPEISANSQARTIGGTLSPVPSGTIYSLNGQGCGWIAQGDVGYFQSLGFSFGGNYGMTFFSVPVAATGTTSYQVATLPAHAAIIGIGAQNTDATHAVTGGITCGPTTGTTTIMSTALAIAAATSVTVPLNFFAPSPNILLPVPVAGVNSTQQQTVWCQSASSWNTPTTVTISVYYMLF